jgi:hypothetical protein
MLCGARDRTCGQQEIGASIMTMLQHIPRTWFRLFLARNQTPVLQQAPYSPEIAPCDFWLFPKLKRPMKGMRFQTREDIMAATTAELNSIPKEAFRHASNNGGTAGKSVWSPKGTTLRVIRCPTLQVSQFFPRPKGGYFSIRPRILRTVVKICNALWSLYVPYSGINFYRTAVTICTAQR